jgi:hypothetical protein
MIPLWDISGEFFGWSSEVGEFYNSKGKRRGTISNNVLYDQNGLYVGEIIQEQYVGRHEDHLDWLGPICINEGEVLLEPMHELMGLETYSFHIPDSLL